MNATTSNGNPKRAFTIKEFCDSIGISVATFYRHKETMPRVTNIGRCNKRVMLDDWEAWDKQNQGEVA